MVEDAWIKRVIPKKRNIPEKKNIPELRTRPIQYIA